MNTKITKDIIGDLFPLYVSQDCSSDTRALVENYLGEHPAEAEVLRRLSDAMPSLATPRGKIDETASLREARRRLKSQSWLMAIAIFCSLLPFAFYADGKRIWWFLREAPVAAAVYGAIGMVCWLVYFKNQRGNRGL